MRPPAWPSAQARGPSGVVSIPNGTSVRAAPGTSGRAPDGSAGSAGALAVGGERERQPRADRGEADRDSAAGAAPHDASVRRAVDSAAAARHGPRPDGRASGAPSSVSYSTRSRAIACTTAQLALQRRRGPLLGGLDDRARLGVDALERPRPDAAELLQRRAEEDLGALLADRHRAERATCRTR